MSIQGYLSDRFADELATLIGQAASRLDGLNLADVLQRAATEAMKKCCGDGHDARFQACLEMLNDAQRELVEEVAARQNTRFAPVSPRDSDGDWVPF